MTSARTLWMGDIEAWMDDSYIIKIFQDMSKIFS